MKTYHIPFSSDGDATKAFFELGPKISVANGHRHIAPSLGNGRAFLVVHLPEELTTEQVNEITHPHTANEVIVLEIANAQDLPDVPTTLEQEEDDDEGMLDYPWDSDDDEDEEDDEGWIDEEEYDVDESEEDSGDQPGEGSGNAVPAEGTAGSEATTLGSSEISPE